MPAQRGRTRTADGLTGFAEAVQTAFPQTVFQVCIVHMIRASLRYVTRKERKTGATALRPIYAAENELAASRALDAFESKYGAKYPGVVRLWRARWQEIVPFLEYPAELRRVLCTTNAIESLNFQLRKALKPRGHFPTDDALMKICFLALQRAKTRWRPSPDWNRALAHFAIMFEGRLPA